MTGGFAAGIGGFLTKIGAAKSQYGLGVAGGKPFMDLQWTAGAKLTAGYAAHEAIGAAKSAQKKTAHGRRP